MSEYKEYPEYQPLVPRFILLAMVFILSALAILLLGTQLLSGNEQIFWLFVAMIAIANSFILLLSFR